MPSADAILEGVRSDQAAAGLAEPGFCVLEDVLSAAETAELRARVHAIAAEDVGAGLEWRSNGNQKVFMLLNRGHQFLDLALHPVGMRYVQQLIGPDALLSSITAHITHPGNSAQALHADQGYVPPPWPYVAAMNLIWMLDDFTPENGATLAVPGSQRYGRNPSPEDGEPETVPVTGGAGSLLVLDGRLWHGSGINRTAGQTRAGILAHYCGPYLRQQENVFRSLRPDVRRRLTAEQRRLLGYDIWSGLGVVDGPPRDWVGRPSRSGPTNADGIFD